MFRHITEECLQVKKPTIRDIDDMAFWLDMGFRDEEWNNCFTLSCYIGVQFKRTDIELKLAQLYLIETNKHLSSGKTLEDAWKLAMDAEYPEDDEIARMIEE